MAQPRMQCLNTARRIALRPLEIRAALSSSAVMRNDNRSGSSQPASHSHNSFRLPTGKKHPKGPTSAGTERIASMISGALARRSRQNQNMMQGRRPGQASLNTVQELENAKRGSELSKQITRRWKVGDVYTPHDLSSVEMEKWKKRERPTYDVFDVLNFKPLDNYRNFSIMSEYMSPTGRIKPPSETGLRPVNQRKIAKAIRRTIGMGLMPSIHKHPEILQKIAIRTERFSPLR